MVRTKSILLTATALGLFGLAGQARAQDVEAQGITFLSPPAQPDPSNSIFPDSHVFPTGITADGSTVVALILPPFDSPNFDLQAQNQNYFHIWTNGVLQVMATNNAVPPEGRGNGFSPLGISGDGSTVVGTRAAFIDRPNGAASFTRAATWTQANGVTFLPDLSATEIASPEIDVNADGSVFAVTIRNHPYNPDGSSNPARFAPRRAYRYSLAGGYQSLGSFGPAINMAVSGISGPGDVISGNAYDTFNNNFDIDDDVISQFAFRWSEAGGLVRLPDLAVAPAGGALATFSATRDVSRDGSTIVGYSRGEDGRDQAVYWRGDAVQGLGFLSGRSTANAFTIANAISADGSVIVGTATTTTGDYFRGWHWTAETGMQDLNVLAQNAGLNLNGFLLEDAIGISDNGQYITGSATKGPLDGFGFSEQIHGYVLSITAAPPPPVNTTSTARLLIRLTLPGVTQESLVTQNFATQIDGLLNGTTVTTRNVADTFSSSAGTAALNDVRGLLQQSGGLRRVTIGAPTLVSSTTQVLSSTSTTTDVAGETQVTTANVVTSGPATVATGDLGTCATAASSGVNPTGCSLAGTPLAVVTGSTNTNTFTNTITSVTPTTTVQVEQLVTARWQVAATAGNQFGTVHALAGVAAFDRGDRFLRQLLSRSGDAPGPGRQVARSASPVTRAEGLGGNGGLAMFGGAYGDWTRTDADARVPVAMVRGSSSGLVLGLEQTLGENARLGVAVDHGTSDRTVLDTTYPESLRLKQTQLALFGGWNSGAFRLDGAAAYGFGSVRTSLATPTTAALAHYDADSWSLGAEGGYEVPLGDTASVELVAGARHVSARLGRFSETGGPTPLAGLGTTVDRTRMYAGLEGTTVVSLGGATVTPRVYARLAYDSGDASGTADLVLASAPTGPVMQALGPGVGRSVAELGGSLDLAAADGVNLWVGYDGALRNQARVHSIRAGATIRW